VEGKWLLVLCPCRSQYTGEVVPHKASHQDRSQRVSSLQPVHAFCARCPCEGLPEARWHHPSLCTLAHAEQRKYSSSTVRVTVWPQITFKSRTAVIKPNVVSRPE